MAKSDSQTIVPIDYVALELCNRDRCNAMSPRAAATEGVSDAAILFLRPWTLAKESQAVVTLHRRWLWRELLEQRAVTESESTDAPPE